MKSPRDVAKVVDADWTGSDRPVLATVEGCVQVFDLTLKLCSCTIEDREFPGNSMPYMCEENKYTVAYILTGTILILKIYLNNIT